MKLKIHVAAFQMLWMGKPSHITRHQPSPSARDEFRKEEVMINQKALPNRHFVPNITIGAPVLASVAKTVEGAYMDCHMMVADPMRWIDDVAGAGGASYTFHLEACFQKPDSADHDPLAIIDRIHASGMRAGVAISPDTPSEKITDSIAAKADLLLVMTVHPGRGGQKFIDACVVKVAELRARFPQKDIQVDGGVGPKTVKPCAEAGVYCLGSNWSPPLPLESNPDGIF
jgi:ribulose-phosphate 3-epimerase